MVAVFTTRGTPWQFLHDYQYRRIDTFLDPSADPLGAGYNIMQAKIALGSGGWGGKGFMQGTQSRLNFLPEKHTDFIFTTLGEEFGFVGAFSLLVLYGLILFFCFTTALQNKDRFSQLLIIGLAANFFLLPRRQPVDGDGHGPGGGGAPALPVLWRIGDAGALDRLWLDPKRPCPQAKVTHDPDDPFRGL